MKRDQPLLYNIILGMYGLWGDPFYIRHSLIQKTLTFFDVLLNHDFKKLKATFLEENNYTFYSNSV